MQNENADGQAAGSPSEDEPTPTETDRDEPGDNHNGDNGGILENHLTNAKKSNAFFLLRTKEANLLTQKCLDDIVEGATQLVRYSVESVGIGVRECLDRANIQFDCLPGPGCSKPG